MILSFLRNKVVEVEPLPDGRLDVLWRLTDSFNDIEIRLKVQPPDLTITEAEANIKRNSVKECLSAPELIKKVIDVRIGPGLRKIVRSLIGGSKGCPRLFEGVMESSNAVILHFTKAQLEVGEKLSSEERLEATRENLKNNPRMARSCIVFADDSPVMKGLNL